MIASVTKMMEDTEDIYIPYSEYDSVNKIVKPASFLQLLDSMNVDLEALTNNLDTSTTNILNKIQTESGKKELMKLI